MNQKKDLSAIRKRAEELLQGVPDKRAKLLLTLGNAEADLAQAGQAQAEATDLETYDKAAEDAKRAGLAVKFAKQAIERFDSTPRMNEEEYFGYITTCRGIMGAAVSTYRQKATALMEQLKAITDEYKQTAAEVNSALEALDTSANILQAKHPHRVYHYQGRPDQRIKDPEAWKKYATRYNGYIPCTLATRSNEDDPITQCDVAVNNVLWAAWRAIRDGYPEEEDRNFMA